MAAKRIIGSKELANALKRSGAQSSWSYRAATPSKTAIKNMEKRASKNSSSS